jgi:glycosyltransferase involved in cell wall biosynthesis
MSDGPELSVVVCTHNGAATLRACLESLASQAIDAGAYEVVVVDNASTDGTAGILDEVARRFPAIRRVDEGRPGKSRAANAGLEASRGRVVAFTDDDVLVPPDWAARIVAGFRSGASPPPQVLLGHVETRFETVPPAWLAAWQQADAARRTSRGACELAGGRDVYIAYGANFAFERETLIAAGGFDESWGPVGSDLRCGGEDVELVARLAAKGAKVRYDPELHVEHCETPATMTLRYRMRRTYLQGVMVSRLEGTVLLSQRTLRGGCALLRRKLRADRGTVGTPMSLRGHGAGTRIAALLLRASAVVGRVRGARLL